MKLLVLAVVVIVAFCAYLVFRRFGRRRLPSHQEVAACPSCGWKGVVSRYAGRCPSCNEPIGEQKARRPAR